MAVRNGQVTKYLPIGGINLSLAPNLIPEDQCVSSENMAFDFTNQGRLVKRLGAIKNTGLTGTKVKASLFVQFPGKTTIPVLAVNGTASDTLYAGNPLVPMAGASLAAGATYTMVEYDGVLYIFNTYNVYTSTDGINYAAATLPTALPDMPAFGFIYLDRMYYGFGPNSPYANMLYYSDPTTPLSMMYSTQSLSIGQFQGESVLGMGLLTWVSAQTGPTGMLGIFKRDSMWVLTGDPLLANSALFQISNIVGCLSADTIVNTPAGTIWVSPDNIYANQGGQNIPIGDNIFPVIQSLLGSGLESQMFAVFHNNFYKLYIPNGSGGFDGYWYNTLAHGDPKSGWYGPMTGLVFSTMAVDPSENLWGGDTSPNWYQLDADVYTDNGAGYDAILTTRTFDMGAFYDMKRFFQAQFQGQAEGAGTLEVKATLDGNTEIDVFLPYGTAQSLWDVMIWDQNSWSGAADFQDTVPFNPPLAAHKCSFVITQTDAFSFSLEEGAILWNPVRKIA